MNRTTVQRISRSRPSATSIPCRVTLEEIQGVQHRDDGDGSTVKPGHRMCQPITQIRCRSDRTRGSRCMPRLPASAVVCGDHRHNVTRAETEALDIAIALGQLTFAERSSDRRPTACPVATEQTGHQSGRPVQEALRRGRVSTMLLLVIAAGIVRPRAQYKMLIVKLHDRNDESRADAEQHHAVNALQGTHQLPVRLRHKPRSASCGHRIN